VFMPLLVQPVSASYVPAARPCERSGHGAPVFTSDLRDKHFGCEHTGPLCHVTGFPGIWDCYGSSAHPVGISRHWIFPPTGTMPAGEGTGGMVPTFTI